MISVIPVTLLLVTIQFAIFLNYIVLGNIREVCLNFDAFIRKEEYVRIFLAPMFHVSETHLFYNILSLLWMGSYLERILGSFKFIFIVATHTLLSGLVYLILLNFSNIYLNTGTECAVGFSAVLFAMKVMLNEYFEISIFRFIPFVSFQWHLLFEIVLVQILVPTASVYGHFSGIIAGFVYIYSARWLYKLIEFIYFMICQISVSLCFAILLIALHNNILSKPWPTYYLWRSVSSLVCISSYGVFEDLMWLRLISGPLDHFNSAHLAICLLSFLLKSWSLEPQFNKFRYFFFIPFVILWSSFWFVVISWLVSQIYPSLYWECFRGLSLCLFCLKVPCLFGMKSRFSLLGLFELLELIVFLSHKNSRLYHISGLLAGVCIVLSSYSVHRFPNNGIKLGISPSLTRSWDYASVSPFRRSIEHKLEDFSNSSNYNSENEEENSSSVNSMSIPRCSPNVTQRFPYSGEFFLTEDIYQPNLEDLRRKRLSRFN